ncbi:MAG: hypothetical protein QOJ79_568 [Actinomycetota bacterium]|jgi:hypothetical protein|nr:hypothetical protein [Actinomycetota bacterium]
MAAVPRPPRLRSSITGPVALVVITGVLATGCGGSSAETAATPSPTPSPTTATERPTQRPSGSLPPEAATTPGGKYYAVFLAVAGDAKDPALADAQERAKVLGYQGGVGDINCTPGARAALHLSDSGAFTAYSIFFATSEQAQAFASSYSGRVVGTAYVTAGCLD